MLHHFCRLSIFYKSQLNLNYIRMDQDIQCMSLGPHWLKSTTRIQIVLHEQLGILGRRVRMSDPKLFIIVWIGWELNF